MLINLLIAIVLGWLAMYICERGGMDRPFSVIVGVIVGFIIFTMHLF